MLKVVLSIMVIFTLIGNGYAQTGEKMKRGAGTGAALGALAGVIFGDGDIISDAADGAFGGAATGAAVGLISGEVEKGRDRKNEKQRQEQIEIQRQKQYNSQQQLIAKFGRDNIEAYGALLDQNYARAEALAGAGETSNDSNHRLAAVWIKAMIAVDQRKDEKAKSVFDQLIAMDPILDTQAQASIEVDKLVLEMRKERLGV